MKVEDDKMQTLDSNIEVLENFKDTKVEREENLNRQAIRTGKLKKDLADLK